MNPYKVRQIDALGQVLSEKQVAAQTYNAALRQLDDVLDETQRIQVFNDVGEKAGEMNVDYWRRTMRRR